jgi:short-subunit dehydrogenase
VSTAKTALITGAGSGIGAEVAMRLAKQGFHLIVSGSNRGKLETLVDRLPGSADIEVVDLAAASEVESFCERIREKHVPLDVAFINAGMVVPGKFADRSSESIDREIDVNFRSAVHLIQACIPEMKVRQQGHIVATSSIGAILALGDSSVYSATKFALRGFLSGLQQELGKEGIKVSGLYPGAIDTEMLRYEAENGGSALNFLHPPASVAEAGDAFMKILRTGQLEAYVPYRDSISARVLSLFPGIVPRLLPKFLEKGEAGREKYLNRA